MLPRVVPSGGQVLTTPVSSYSTVLYDPNDQAGSALLNSIFENGSSGESCDFVFNEPAGGTFSCSAFLTTINPSVSVGDIQAVSVNFQISGAIEGRY